MSLNLSSSFSRFNLKVDKPFGQTVYAFEDFCLDAEQLMLSRDGEEIALPPKVVETLLVLVVHRGKIVSKDQLLEAVWKDVIVEESNLYGYLHVLRNTLGNQQNGKPFIETRHRRGYRFNGNVHVIHQNVEEQRVDGPKQKLANVETRSGRVYVVTNGNRDDVASVKTGSLTSAQPAMKPVDSPDYSGVAEDVFGSTGPPADFADTPLPYRNRRIFITQRLFLAAISAIGILVLAVAGFLYFGSARQIRTIADRGHTENAEAYRLYLEGNDLLQR